MTKPIIPLTQGTLSGDAAREAAKQAEVNEIPAEMKSFTLALGIEQRSASFVAKNLAGETVQAEDAQLEVAKRGVAELDTNSFLGLAAFRNLTQKIFLP